METTQKNREETARRRPRPEGAAPQWASRPEGAAQRPPQKKRPAAPAQKQSAGTKQRPGSQVRQPVKKAAAKTKRPAPKADPEDISNKKRAYGKSKPKKKSSISAVATALKKPAKKRTQAAKPARPKEPTPAVIYTQPQAFNRSRFLIQLLSVTAIVAALVLGVSVFFKVDKITVSGADVYSAWAVEEASGISQGDNLLTFSHARAGAQIMANLPYVKTVRFGIKLPDTVNIIIEEEDVVYAIKDTNSQWWLMNSAGHVVEQTNNGKASNYTQVLGVNLDAPQGGENAVAAEALPTETLEDGSPVPVTVTGAQRLNAALQILKALEDNDIVGDAASVDVTRIEDIVLWYGTRYQVNLGDNTRLPHKIDCMNDVILQMSEYQSGILDVSFTLWPSQVAYTPFA